MVTDHGTTKGHNCSNFPPILVGHQNQGISMCQGRGGQNMTHAYVQKSRNSTRFLHGVDIVYKCIQEFPKNWKLMERGYFMKGVLVNTR
jgi:hypothetical protein